MSRHVLRPFAVGCAIVAVLVAWRWTPEPAVAQESDAWDRAIAAANACIATLKAIETELERRK